MENIIRAGSSKDPSSIRISSLKETAFSKDRKGCWEYALTEDTTPEEGRRYFKKDSGSFIETTPIENPMEEGLYVSRYTKNPGYIEVDLSSGLDSLPSEKQYPDISPDVGSQIGVQVDVFCEKPAYLPFDKGEDGGHARYYPLGDNLKGYDLCQYLSSDRVLAHSEAGLSTEGTYRSIKGSAFTKLEPQPTGDDDVEGYYLFFEDSTVPLDRGVNSCQTIYYRPGFSNREKYGRGICHSYKGLLPGYRYSGNLLKYDDGKDSWEDNWQGHAGITVGTGNIYNAPDGVAIILNRGTTFTKTVVLGPGTYTFSYFARVDDSCSDDINRHETLNNPYTALLTLPGDGGTPINIIDTEWERHFKTFTLDRQEDCTIGISFPYGGDLPLKVCGMMLTETPYPMVYRPDGQNYSSAEEEESDVVRPLDIEFIESSGAAGWTAYYTRSFYAEKGRWNAFECIDSLGKSITFGHREGKLFLMAGGNTDSREVVWDDIHTDKSCCASFVEKVHLVYENGRLTCTTVIGTEKYGLSVLVSGDDFRGMFPGDDVTYDLLLGGYVEGDEVICLMSAAYTGLVVYNRPIGFEAGFRKAMNTPMVISTGRCYDEKYPIDGEGTEVEYSNIDEIRTVLMSSLITETTAV